MSYYLKEDIKIFNTYGEIRIEKTAINTDDFAVELFFNVSKMSIVDFLFLYEKMVTSDKIFFFYCCEHNGLLAFTFDFAIRYKVTNLNHVYDCLEDFLNNKKSLWI